MLVPGMTARTADKQRPMRRRGLVVVGVCLTLLLLAGLIGDGLLLLLALCGGFLLGLAWGLGWWSLRNLEVKLQMPRLVMAGRPFELELSLSNRRLFFDSLQTELEVELPGEIRVEGFAVWTAAGACSRMERTMHLPSRGHADEHLLRVSTGFPLGLFCQRRTWLLRAPITVMPRPIQPQELNSDGSLHDAQPRSGVTMGQSFGEPRGIRPWQAGDGARRIHWPASARSFARGHGLRVREYDPPGFYPDHCHLVFHSYATGGEMLRQDRFERAVSLLAGAVMCLQGNGMSCEVSADFNDWQAQACQSREQVMELMVRLARVERNPGTEAHDLQRVLAGVSTDHALLVISDMAPDSWDHLLVHHPHTLVVDIRQIRYRHRSLHAMESAGGSASPRKKI